jgi:hypothetical protein
MRESHLLQKFVSKHRTLSIFLSFAALITFTLFSVAIIVMSGKNISLEDSVFSPLDEPTRYIAQENVTLDVAASRLAVAEKLNLNRKILVPTTSSQPSSIAALVEQYGGTVISQSASGIVIDVPPQTSDALEEALVQGGSVKEVEVDFPIFLTSERVEWSVMRIDAPRVWDTVAGQGVRVGIVDTGIDYNHPDLRNRYAGGFDLINNDSDPFDDHGHGTHVAGIVAADLNGVGVVGVAPAASLYALKVLSNDGTGYISDLVQAVDWAIANNLDVLNFSLGTTYDSKILEKKLGEAASKGIILVAAAGNTGGGAVMYPAAYREVISVSATDSSDKLASFSSLGAELAAPGVAIRSTVPGGGYATWSGTSMAAPHVTATVALMMSNGQSNIRESLRSTAMDLGPVGVDSYFGHGLIHARPAALGEDVLAPVVTFLSPVHESSVTGMGVVQVELRIQDESAITSASLEINGNQVVQWQDEPYTYSWNTESMPEGEYVLVARAKDEFGNEGSAQLRLKVSRDIEPMPESELESRRDQATSSANLPGLRIGNQRDADQRTPGAGQDRPATPADDRRQNLQQVNPGQSRQGQPAQQAAPQAQPQQQQSQSVQSTQPQSPPVISNIQQRNQRPADPPPQSSRPEIPPGQFNKPDADEESQGKGKVKGAQTDSQWWGRLLFWRR